MKIRGASSTQGPQSATTIDTVYFRADHFPIEAAGFLYLVRHVTSDCPYRLLSSAPFVLVFARFVVRLPRIYRFVIIPDDFSTIRGQ